MRRKREKKDMRQAECVGGCVGGVYERGRGERGGLVQREKPVQGQECSRGNDESLQREVRLYKKRILNLHTRPRSRRETLKKKERIQGDTSSLLV